MTARLNGRALANLRGTLQSHIDRGRIPGAIAVVARGGHVELFDCLGQQEPQGGTPMRDDAIFRIYSMTKPIVSLAALILMEEGALQMNDPLSKFLPEFAGAKVAVEAAHRCGSCRRTASRRCTTCCGTRRASPTSSSAARPCSGSTTP